MTVKSNTTNSTNLTSSGRQQKKKVISDNALHKKDTGSVQVQIAVLTEKIRYLTDHLKTHQKDDHGRRGLLHAVGKRRKLLEYLKKKDKEAYKKILSDLNLRR